MKTKAERKESYLCPEVTLTRVILEESMVAIQSPVNGITLDGWDDGGSNDPGDSGNIYLGL